MTHSKQRGWREVCEEALRERGTEKAGSLMEELLRTLEQRPSSGREKDDRDPDPDPDPDQARAPK